MKTKALWVAAVFLLCTGCGSASRVQESSSAETNTTPPAASETATVIETESETEPPTEAASRISLVAVGDNLIHTRVYKTAQEHAEGGEAYNFGFCYEHVADTIAAADIAFVNQETLICGGKFEISGSDMNFCSPDELGEALAEVGFDIINLANNHVLDKGEEGLAACLDYWDKEEAAHPGLLAEGVYQNEADMNDYRIIEKNGIKVGFLGYTAHTNGYSLPEDSEIIIPSTEDRALMERQIKEVKQMADCVVVSAHWGAEDTHVVSEEVKTLAQDLVNWGADIVIGTGPHTLQTMGYLTREDGSRGFVYYSLGNFISGQTDSFNMVGGMAEVDIVKENDKITIEAPGLMPLITQYEGGGLKDVRVYPYNEYTDDLIAAHGLPASPMGTAKTWSREVIRKIIEENVPPAYRLCD